MAPTIRIDDEVYAWLQAQARPFEDTPNSVLRRISQIPPSSSSSSPTAKRGKKTPQGDYRIPLLRILVKHGGKITRVAALAELDKALSKQLTPYDKEHIKSGDVRWKKSAEWEVRAMREEGLIKAVEDGPRGYWVLSEHGRSVARSS